MYTVFCNDIKYSELQTLFSSPKHLFLSWSRSQQGKRLKISNSLGVWTTLCHLADVEKEMSFRTTNIHIIAATGSNSGLTKPFKEDTVTSCLEKRELKVLSPPTKIRKKKNQGQKERTRASRWWLQALF